MSENNTPSTSVHSCDYLGYWRDRANSEQGLSEIEPDEITRMVAELGLEEPKNLNGIGRYEWAQFIGNRLVHGWALPLKKSPDEVRFGSSGICMS